MTIQPDLLDKPPSDAQNSQAAWDARAISNRLSWARIEHGPTWLLSPLWLCLLVAVLIRVWLAMRTHGTLDGDEALLGIQAEHILRGERPIYFYGIPYFGSLEAYVAALLIAIFGPSVAALRAETTGFSLVLVCVTWWLASLLAQAAKLPQYARRWFTTLAALVAALPPLYDGIVELRTGGGWIESFILMLLLLICVYRLTSRRHGGANWRELALRWAGVGFVAGFGMWIYPLVTVAILAAALWIVIDRVVEINKRVRSSETVLAASVQAFRDLPLALTALPACVLGFTPGIIWGATHQWANIAYLFSLGGGWTGQRLHTVARVATRYTACVAPRVIGGATPREGILLTVIHFPLLLIGVFCTLGTAALVVGSFRWQHPILLRVRSLAALPTLFGACSAVLFCTSSASASILLSCTADFGGRYAAPLALVLPFFVATAFTLIHMFLYEKREIQSIEDGTRIDDENRRGETDADGERWCVGMDTDGERWRGETGADGQHRRYTLRDSEASSLCISNHWWERISISVLRKRPVVLLGAVFTLLVAYFGGQATTYGLTNANLAFQSPYCTIAPANYAPLIAYMEHEDIRYAWATNLLGYQISFETNNVVILADPLPLIHPAIAINRIPAYTDAVARADRPSFLVFIKHGDPHPYLLQLLTSEHVVYKAAFFPSQPGVDVMVVTPLSRNVSPFASASFDIFYCATR